MVSRLTGLFWLVLISALLPMQSLSAASNTPLGQPISSEIEQSASVLFNPLQLDSKTEKSLSEGISSPITEIPQLTQQHGIIYSSRWSVGETLWQDDEDSDIDGSGLNVVPCLNGSCRLISAALLATPYQHFHTSYRLSGWKETNAMYVALNSQFFTV
ncbi:MULTISPECIES: hypothetical protein [unclassified Vibrio]|uniref:hypothetical protein n=1 Tax=unclassified Vibrio TaxID=2614977 RepID=UPI00148264A6|nr:MULTISPECIES: hypothetical protein [unclassified Vibrio]NNN45040.1 hypothetical protein [Vibrio sp. 1-1(7)]NNN72413.1 hypothetical protein [Vibrio sp. 12-2(3-a)]